jgi:hypothetical protein
MDWRRRTMSRKITVSPTSLSSSAVGLRVVPYDYFAFLRLLVAFLIFI